MKEVFRHQKWNLISIIFFIALLQLLVFYSDTMILGNLWGVETIVWFWVAVSIPIIHQTYVWLVWRLELYKSTFTSRFGLKRAFNVYSIGFTILFFGRVAAILILAISSRNTFPIYPFAAYLLVAVITPLIIYLAYSVIKYFTLARAFGIDHFDKNYKVPYVKQGIFRFTNNGMYIYGLMILYLPGLLLFSKAALLVALFNHLYIWIHYYCTEQPDMKVIYGNRSEST